MNQESAVKSQKILGLLHHSIIIMRGGPDIEFEEGAIINETAPGVASDFIFNGIRGALEPGGVEAVAAASARAAQATAARTQDCTSRARHDVILGGLVVPGKIQSGGGLMLNTEWMRK